MLLLRVEISLFYIFSFFFNKQALHLILLSTLQLIVSVPNCYKFPDQAIIVVESELNLNMNVSTAKPVKPLSMKQNTMTGTGYAAGAAC